MMKPSDVIFGCLYGRVLGLVLRPCQVAGHDVVQLIYFQLNRFSTTYALSEVCWHQAISRPRFVLTC